MEFLRPKVLTPEGLTHIATHKYKPGVWTGLDMLINPGWIYLTEKLPMWLAPNCVTLFGFVPMVCSYVLMWWASPDFATGFTCPQALFCALSLFFYQTMDAMDGKQARRTGASSPLGQLFDHGCDCLSCLSFHSIAGMALLPGPHWSTALGLAALQTSFFIFQWEEYHTGTLHTTVGYLGVTEIELCLIFIAAFAGILGPELTAYWTSTEVPLIGIPIGRVLVAGWVALCVFVVASQVTKTIKAIQAGTASTSAGNLGQAVRHLLPIFAVDVFLFSWHPTVLAKSPRLLLFVTGILNFHLTAQMIVFSMAKMEYPVFHGKTLLPYALLCIASWFLTEQQTRGLMILLAMNIFFHVSMWLTMVAEQLKEKLGIMAFRLPPVKKA